ncbi:acyl-CoA dehydrogenase family protein [Achromobacter marplatensis]|uniref:acyl-CoA dehydrogenase family protein n=1 Tax=Achromobacter marplatensis TaxID=470868 RepID=UPI003CFEDD1B
MDFSLDSTQIELRDSLRRYLAAEVAPIVNRYEAEARVVPQDMVRAMRDFGLLGGMLQEKDGGYGLPMTTYGMLIAELARVWPSLRSIVSTSNLAASVLSEGGSPYLKEKYLPRVLSGDAIASFALTHNVEEAIQAGRSTFDLLRGDEAYKYRFGAQDERVMRVRIERNVQ